MVHSWLQKPSDKYRPIPFNIELEFNEKLGIIVGSSWSNSYLVIQHVEPGSVAALAGIKREDRIVMVDFNNTWIGPKELDLPKLKQIIRNKRNFRLTIFRKKKSFVYQQKIGPSTPLRQSGLPMTEPKRLFQKHTENVCKPEVQYKHKFEIFHGDDVSQSSRSDSSTYNSSDKDEDMLTPICNCDDDDVASSWSVNSCSSVNNYLANLHQSDRLTPIIEEGENENEFYLTIPRSSNYYDNIQPRNRMSTFEQNKENYIPVDDNFFKHNCDGCPMSYYKPNPCNFQPSRLNNIERANRAFQNVTNKF